MRVHSLTQPGSDAVIFPRSFLTCKRPAKKIFLGTLGSSSLGTNSLRRYRTKLSVGFSGVGQFGPYPNAPGEFGAFLGMSLKSGKEKLAFCSSRRSALSPNPPAASTLSLYDAWGKFLAQKVIFPIWHGFVFINFPPVHFAVIALFSSSNVHVIF